jgi:hypothetical protein
VDDSGPADGPTPLGSTLTDLARSLNEQHIIVRLETRSTLRVGFRATGGSAVEDLVLAFAEDAPVRCGYGEPLADCDVVLEADHASVAAALLLIDDDHDLARRFRMRVPGEAQTAAVPPYDLAETPALGELPRIKGASVLAQLMLTDSPFGPVAYQMSIQDGRLAAVIPGLHPDGEIFVALRYADYLDLRSGMGTIEEAMKFGDLDGDFGKVQMFGGLIQEPAVRAALAHLAGSDRVIGEYARACSQTSYRSAAEGLRGEWQQLAGSNGRQP